MRMHSFLIITSVMAIGVATAPVEAQTRAKAPATLRSLHVAPGRVPSGVFTAERQGLQRFLSPMMTTDIADDLPAIYGSVIYNNTFTTNYRPIGLYELPAGTPATTMLIQGPNAISGGAYVDGTYYAVSHSSSLGMVNMTIEAYDVESGTMIRSYTSSDYSILAPAGYAVDPVDDTIYGITYTADMSAMQLSKIVFGEDVSVEKIAPMEGYWNSIAFDKSGQLYGISYYGEYTDNQNFTVTGSTLNKIDKATGEVTKIGETGALPQYLSSSTIDLRTNRMYWNVMSADLYGCMYEVDLQTGHAELLFRLQNDDEIMGMYIPRPEAEDNAPARCDNVSIMFEGTSLKGSATLTTPSTLFDGTTPGSGNLTVTVTANGYKVGSVDAAWDSNVTIPIDLTASGAGMYDFKVYAANSNGDGPKTQVNGIWVGADTPEATHATLNYSDGTMELSWNAVTASVNGGYMEPEAVTYTIRDKNGETVASAIAGTSFSLAVEKPEIITTFYYTVYAVYEGLESEGARTNAVTIGDIIVPPYQSDYEEAGLDGWTIIDANEDNRTWVINSGGWLRIQWNSSIAMDDWLITPAIRLEADKAYNFEFMARSYDMRSPERLEVKMGKAPTAEAMTTTLAEPTIVLATLDNPKQFSLNILPEEDGLYYVGLHGISDPDDYYMYVSNITISEGTSALVPGSASNLKVTPDVAGELIANISFNAPDKTMNGKEISELTKVELFRDDTLIHTFENPAPGEALSYDDTLQMNGDATYTVIAYNAEGKGVETSVSSFIGFSAPSAPGKVTIRLSDVEGEAIVEWEPVTSDLNGLSFPAGEVTYILAANDGQQWVPFAQNIKTTTYSYQAVEAGKQEFIQVAVFASRDGEVGSGTVSSLVPVGTPYAGIHESFANSQASYIWGAGNVGNGSLSIGNDNTFEFPSADEDNGLIVFSAGGSIGSGAKLFSGLVSLEGMEYPTLSFYTYNMTDADFVNENTIMVSVRDAADEEYQQLLDATVTEICGFKPGWHKVYVPLGDFAGKDIQFEITGICKSLIYVWIDNISVANGLEYDLVAESISAPAEMKVGKEFNIEVRVANESAKTAESYKVELYADGVMAGSTEVDKPLESGAHATVAVETMLSPLATEEVDFYAVVVFDKDLDASNNKTETVRVMPITSNLPVPSDLEAVYVNESVRLTWNAPDLASAVPDKVTEDFENGDAFSAKFGNWIFVDADQSPVGYFSPTIPGITPGQTVGSFWIWDNEVIGDPSLSAHSGTKYLFALYRSDYDLSDEWAISPELFGGAQTVSFYASSSSANYPETIEVYYSTGSPDPTDFIKIEGAGGSVPQGWYEFSAQLPEGAKRFAIRSIASGYMLMIDDVTYIPQSDIAADLSVEGYNVYRDGLKINQTPVTTEEYVDDQLTDDKEYTYVVTALYHENGESSPSNEATISTVGLSVDTVDISGISIKGGQNEIIVAGAYGRKITVVTTDGKTIFFGTGEEISRIPMSKGFYIVTAGSTSAKVSVD